MTRRLFLAIPLSPELVSAFQRFERQHPSRDIRWVAPVNLHITVHFIGDIDDVRLPELIEAVRAVTDAVEPFELEFNELMMAPPGKTPRMIWGMFESTDAFKQFVYRVRDAVYGSVGGSVDNHKPVAHVTLTRFKDPAVASQVDLAVLRPASRLLSVASLTLFESELRTRGAQYTPLQTFEFKHFS